MIIVMLCGIWIILIIFGIVLVVVVLNDFIVVLNSGGCWSRVISMLGRLMLRVNCVLLLVLLGMLMCGVW